MFTLALRSLASEMRRRGQTYKEIAERFSLLIDVPHNHNVTPSSTEIEDYSQSCLILNDAYPEGFNTNFSSELQQPMVDTAFHIFYTLIGDLKNGKKSNLTISFV